MALPGDISSTLSLITALRSSSKQIPTTSRHSGILPLRFGACGYLRAEGLRAAGQQRHPLLRCWSTAQCGQQFEAYNKRVGCETFAVKRSKRDDFTHGLPTLRSSGTTQIASAIEQTLNTPRSTKYHRRSFRFSRTIAYCPFGADFDTYKSCISPQRTGHHNYSSKNYSKR